MAMSSAEGRRSLTSEWMVTAPYNGRTTLHDAHYLTAIRKRLGVPVTVCGGRCRVRRGAGAERAWEAEGRMRGRDCGAPLMPHADHAQSCAIHARVRRHDSIADLCAAIHAEAGLRSHRETPVPGVLSSSRKEPIRADVLVRVPPPGVWECTEVKVRHFFHADGHFTLSNTAQVDAALATTEMDVRAKYAPAVRLPAACTARCTARCLAAVHPGAFDAALARGAVVYLGGR
eukprot:gene13036-biopygen11037